MGGAFRFLTFCPLLLLLIPAISTATDTLYATQSFGDGEILVSANQSFRLGFFSPGTSKNKYLGIWYNKISAKTVVWVANREIPITDSSGVLQISDEGILVLINGNGTRVWSSNSTKASRNPVVRLLDSGNLIVKNDGDDDSAENFLWQSFDYPSDSLLPGMKLGGNRATSFSRHLSSWKTSDDPARGSFTCSIDPDGYPEMFIREGSILHSRPGSWNGLRFTGLPNLKPNRIYIYWFVLNDKEYYYNYKLATSSIVSRIVISQNGFLQRVFWIEKTQEWRIYQSFPIDSCDPYGVCGAHGSCNINNSPLCSCLKGFKPQVPKEWELLDWSSGCVRETKLNCSGDGFRMYSALKLPETKKSWFNKSMNLEDCKIMCLKNCSCTAYAIMDISRGSGCLLWFNDLIDIRHYDENGQDIYVRMAASELDRDEDKETKHKWMRIILSSTLSAGMLFLGLAILVYVWKKKQQKDSMLLTQDSNYQIMRIQG